MEGGLAPDWILQQTLAIQQKAHADWLNTKPELKPDDGGLTLCVLGCGTMGIAILRGILRSLRNTSASNSSSTSGSTTPGMTAPQRLPTKFIACVRSAAGAKKVGRALEEHQASISIFQRENVKAVKQADVILLCCEPHAASDVLQEAGMAEALAGKTLVSILGGLSQVQIETMLYGDGDTGIKKCTIVRAMPNVAAAVGESMTVIADSSPPVPEETIALITWIFSRIGKVSHVSTANMDACTALCGSGPAFVALMAESMAAGAIAMGVSRQDAYAMAAQTIRGAAGMLFQGDHPALIRDRISTPGGCTMAGLNVLEENAFRGTVAKAVREATKHLGKREERAT